MWMHIGAIGMQSRGRSGSGNTRLPLGILTTRGLLHPLSFPIKYLVELNVRPAPLPPRHQQAQHGYIQFSRRQTCSLGESMHKVAGHVLSVRR